VKVREPVARPLDVVTAELLLSASQAFLAGVLFYLALGIWDDRGVGFGPVAIILAMLGAAVGVGWLYWLLGGVGWPLAAANVPVAMFLGFALVLGWRGDDLFRVAGAPTLISLAASVYGIICGVFLDSPRRWRWDQRQRLRPGTSVPRVSPTTKTFVAQVPRTLPKRPTATLQPADYLPPSVAPGSGQGSSAGLPYLDADDAIPGRPGDLAPEAGQGTDEDMDGPKAGLMTTHAPTSSTGASMPTERLDQAARAEGAQGSADLETPGSDPGGIELPTSLEPKAQRSPWAWAAPPEWNRDEEDEPPGRSSGGR
jgi:hypothetical protein